MRNYLVCTAVVILVLKFKLLHIVLSRIIKTQFVPPSVVCCMEEVSIWSLYLIPFKVSVCIMYVDVIYMYICTHFYYYGSIYYTIMMCIFCLLFMYCVSGNKLDRLWQQVSVTL